MTPLSALSSPGPLLTRPSLPSCVLAVPPSYLPIIVFCVGGLRERYSIMLFWPIRGDFPSVTNSPYKMDNIPNNKIRVFISIYVRLVTQSWFKNSDREAASPPSPFWWTLLSFVAQLTERDFDTRRYTDRPRYFALFFKQYRKNKKTNSIRFLVL